MKKIRLNKFISDCGLASRRKSEEYINQGRVSVNNELIMDLAVTVDPENDTVKLDGEVIRLKSKVYFIMNKPKGVVTTTDDEKNRTTVVDLIKTGEKIFPVGRLDYNTTGVLILTNDGDFSNKVTHPSNKFKRKYTVTLDRDLFYEDREKMLKGIFLDNRRSIFTEVEFPNKHNRKIVEVYCQEGRNHFVKRMFSTLNYYVKKLHRNSIAGITADYLEEGQYINTSLEELKKAIKNAK